MSEWKPIDTAPRGVPILCAVHLGQSFILMKANNGDFIHWPRSWDDRCKEYAVYGEPTHWMPLPAPPEPPHRIPATT